MKHSSKFTKVGAVAAAIVSLSMPAFGAVVYDNSAASSSQGVRKVTSDSTVGDEVTLAGSDRQATAFDVTIYLSAGSTADATVKFFANDGAFGKPGSLLYSSSSITLAAGQNSYGIDLTTVLNGPVVLPDTFTWAVSFSGLSGGEEAGLYHYGGPSVGSSAADHWADTGAGWELLNTGAGFSDNFAAKVQAVPEPTTLALLGVGAAGLLMARRRKA